MNKWMILCLVTLMSVMACGGEDDGTLLPCPPNGIGADEAKIYKSYDCQQPQICPDIGSRRLTDFKLGDKQAIYFLLNNCSTGDQPLEITKVEILGDEQCSFSDFDLKTDIKPSREVMPGENTAIQTIYEPITKGRDFMQIRVHSNAANFPTLDIPVCGIIEGVKSPDVFYCRDVTDINKSCH